MRVEEKNSMLFILLRTYSQIIKIAPASAISGLVCLIVQSLLPVATAYILANIFDRLTQNQQVDNSLIILGIAYLLANLLMYIAGFLSGIFVNAGIYERCVSQSKVLLAKKTATFPLLWFEDTEILGLYSRAKECADREVLSGIYMNSAKIILSLLSVVGIMLVLATYNPVFIIISLVTVIPFLISTVIQGSENYSVRRNQVKNIRKRDYLWSLFTNKSSIKEIRFFGAEKYLFAAWKEARDSSNHALWKIERKEKSRILICDIVKILGYMASIFIALYLCIDNRITVGAFGACIIAFKAMQDTTRLFLMNIGRFPEQIAYAKDYYSYLELNAGAPTEDSQNKYGFALSEGITVSNLCFKYPNSDDFALEGVSFEVKAGEKIAILGINGSGKTTLSKLLLGLYHPQQGEILFDSHSIEDIERDSFLMNVSIVSQCFIQYQMTLRENIAISQTDDLENDDRIYASLSLFPEDDILHNYELDTVLGKQFGEVELSGGQWQKIAIARGAFKHSKFIILDEPTSALDPLVEGEVLQSFLNTIRNKTAVFVSHRLGFAKLLDRIIILDQGKIVDIGTHDDLMNRCSLYKTMFTEQQKWHQHELILDMEG